jgi:hypothetical protein
MTARAALRRCLLAVGLAGVAAPDRAGAQQLHGTLSEDAQQVLATVVERIAGNRTAVVATVIGLPSRCWPTEGAACTGREFTEAAGARVRASAAYVASLLGTSVADDAFAAAREFVAPSVVDSTQPRWRWTRFCGTEVDGQPLGRVLIIRPSVVRETEPGREWRVVVAINDNPTRGECLGHGSAHDYILDRDPTTGALRIARMEFLGGGTGTLRGPFSADTSGVNRRE